GFTGDDPESVGHQGQGGQGGAEDQGQRRRGFQAAGRVHGACEASSAPPPQGVLRSAVRARAAATAATSTAPALLPQVVRTWLARAAISASLRRGPKAGMAPW